MNEPCLLLVEDNTILSQQIRQSLRPYFRVFQAPTLQSAIAHLETQSVTLVVLDRSLPDGDGLELLTYLQQFRPEIPVCIVSQAGTLRERLTGFTAGSDAYLPKPFHMSELKVQLFALLRRGRLRQASLLHLQDLLLDRENRIIRRAEHCTELTERETELLALFFQAREQFVSIEKLQEWFWQQGLKPSRSLVYVNIQRLRRKLVSVKGKIEARYAIGYALRLEPLYAKLLHPHLRVPVKQV